MDEQQRPRLVIPLDNRPEPLDLASVPIWANQLCQMSFGERAALEGVLSQCKPRLAIEIGTYEGGSLGLLVRHSEHVHTFDLQDLIADRTAFANVTFHVGDSKALLPKLLRMLEANGQTVDLVLVDGDHSADGVRQDLVNLLESSATGSTLVLLHDTINEDTRAGIASVDPASYAKIIYWDLDFVRGYEFAGGHFDGQMWGGLGLVVTGDRPAAGYRESPIQTRYRDASTALHEALRTRREAADLRDRLALSEHWLDAVQSSVSWRITEPLRRVKRRLQRSRPSG